MTVVTCEHQTIDRRLCTSRIHHGAKWNALVVDAGKTGEMSLLQHYKSELAFGFLIPFSECILEQWDLSIEHAFELVLRNTFSEHDNVLWLAVHVLFVFF